MNYLSKEISMECLSSITEMMQYQEYLYNNLIKIKNSKLKNVNIVSFAHSLKTTKIDKQNLLIKFNLCQNHIFQLPDNVPNSSIVYETSLDEDKSLIPNYKGSTNHIFFSFFIFLMK